MKFDRSKRAGSRRSAFSAHAADPDLFFSDSPHPKPDYHTRALCKQVQRTLATVLAGECADPLLQDLRVLAVLPAPNAGHLLVVVSPCGGEGTLTDFLERLKKVTPLLRARIAQETTRKRTPELSFDVLGKGVAALEVPPGAAPQGADDPKKEEQP